MTKYFLFDGDKAYLSKKPNHYFDHIGTVKVKIFDTIYKTEIYCKKCELQNNHCTLHKDIYPSIPVSYLKSQLQKCIRRKEVDLTIQTINSLFAKNAEVDLLRRLIVISGEDVMVNPSTITLIWYLTGVSKGMKLTDKMKNHILYIGKKLAEYDFQDKEYLHMNVTKSDVESSLSNDVSFILQIGRGYLGMKGDLLMCHKLSCIWYNRLLQCSTCASLEVSLYKLWDNDKNYNDLPQCSLSQLSQLSPSDIMLPSIDFHITNIDERIKSVYNAELSMIKSAIWTYSSNINKRVYTNIKHINSTHDVKLHNLWNNISIIFDIEAQKIKTNLNI